MLRIIVWVQNILKKIRKDRIAAYSGQSAYFLILSFLPFLLFLLTLVQHLPIKIETMMDAIFLVIPRSYEGTVQAILDDIHVESGATILSLSVIITIWTAGKGIMALSDGLNSVQEIEENRNYFILRLKAALYTLLFAIVIIFTVIVLVFGNRIYYWLRTAFPNMPEYSQLLNMLRSFIAIGFYILIFTLFYKFLPAKPMKTLKQLPGGNFYDRRMDDRLLHFFVICRIFQQFFLYVRQPFLFDILFHLFIFNDVYFLFGSGIKLLPVS